MASEANSKDTETGLPASPLSSADASKHGAEPAKTDAKANGADPAPAEAKTNAPPAEASPAAGAEQKTEKAPAADAAKPDKPAADAKPADTKSPAESGEKKAPETKAEPDGKPADTKADAKDAPAETQPQAPPAYEALKLPEGTTLDNQQLGKFDELVSNAEIKARTDPHAAIAELRQNAVDMYLGEVKRIGDQVAKHQRDVWSRLVEQRVNELRNDPDLGGNRIETSLGNAKYALESLVPGFSKQEATELIGIMDAGGVSHSRLMIKLLNKIYDVFAEPEPLPGDKPPALKGKEPGARGWYDKTDSSAPATR